MRCNLALVLVLTAWVAQAEEAKDAPLMCQEDVDLSKTEFAKYLDTPEFEHTFTPDGWRVPAFRKMLCDGREWRVAQAERPRSGMPNLEGDEERRQCRAFARHIIDITTPPYTKRNTTQSYWFRNFKTTAPEWVVEPVARANTQGLSVVK